MLTSLSPPVSVHKPSIIRQEHKQVNNMPGKDTLSTTNTTFSLYNLNDVLNDSYSTISFAVERKSDAP